MTNSIDFRLAKIQFLKESLKVNTKPTSALNTKAPKGKPFYIDEGFFPTVGPLLSYIPESNGSRIFSLKDVTVGIVADEFLYRSFEGVAQFIYITPDNFEEHKNSLDLFLVASTWKGLNGEWQGIANAKNSEIRSKLFAIINECKSLDIPTIFYSKEDPVNYDIYIDTAKRCDYVFTTAREILSDYRRDCGHDKVDVLEFGINPLYHNPIGYRNVNLKDSVIFSGSWYEKYPERCHDNKIIFDGILEAEGNLKIIDRNYHLKYPPYIFPQKYHKYLSPAVEHKSLQKLHKLYNWGVNLNSIQYSQTMFANRIYELQAMGNVLLSNYSIGVNSQFPNVFLVESEKECRDILNTFDDAELYRHQQFGIRQVMNEHCNFYKLSELLSKLGFSSPSQNTSVLVIALEDSNEINESYQRQVFDNKKLVLLNEVNEFDVQNADVVVFFSTRYFYEEFYLQDMINAFKYTDSDFVTKDAYFNGQCVQAGVENNYCHYIKDKARTAYWASVFDFERINNGNIEGEVSNGYSIDPYEITLSNIENAFTPRDYKYSVIVPAYNNGSHLLNKCFNSLRRSSTFEEMEIVIVDDGSTDNFTKPIINRLQRYYPNVKSYFYDDGGSGSASRPRNKGLELSSTEYITYLDPDNEALNDGYTKLYDSMMEKGADLVVGNMLRLADSSLIFNPNKGKVNELSGNGKDFVEKYNFPTQSTQALMVKKSLLIEKNVDMVHGAVGEDTLFYHELLLHSQYTVFINEMIHIYYAAVDGSTVNAISSNFFKKHLILEKERVIRFEKYGLLEAYKKNRFEFYYRHWYLDKLSIIKLGDEEEAKQILLDIFNMYSSIDSVKDDEIKNFITSI